MSHNFLGGQNYNKFGVNVIQRHSSKRQRTSHQVRRHDLLCVGCNVVTSYVRVLQWCVSLRRMSVCCRELYMCQGFPVISMMDRMDFIAAFLLSCGTRWWNILKWSYEQQRCHSSITSDWWTIYVYEFSVVGWPPSSRHLYCFRSEMLLLQRLLMQRFSSSVHHFPQLQLGQRTFIISLFFSTKTSASSLQLELWIVIDNRVNSEKLYNIVNCDSRLVVILSL